MNEIKICATCRTVTPMMASGANQQRLEIRATEVKAGLRFWWRAFQPLSGGRLFDAETNLFGGVSRASPFTVRVFHEKFANNEKWDLDQNHGWGPGIQYVLFSVNAPENKTGPAKIKDASNEKNKGRPIAKSCKVFEIHLQLGLRHKSHTGDLLCALWLLENLGGLGGRTRRGAGCFEITSLALNDMHLEEAGKSPDFKDLLAGTPSFDFAETPEKFLGQGIGAVLARWDTAARVAAPDYTACYAPTGTVDPAADPHCSEIWVAYDAGGGSNANRVMEKTGDCLKQYCDTHPQNEADEMHTALDEKTALPTGFELTKAAKGLPIIYNFSGRQKGTTYTATSKVENGKPKGRRASPLLISCHQKGGIAYAVICHFPAPLLHPNEKLRLWPKPYDPALVKVFSKPPDQRFVKEMLHTDRDARRPSILSAFGVTFQLFPSSDATTTANTNAGRATGAPSAKFRAPSQEDLLQRVKALTAGDGKKVKKILEELDILNPCAPEVKTVAVALKKKVSHLSNIWGEFGALIGRYL